MTWTSAQLKAAIGALSPVPVGLAATAAVLNAQMRAAPVDILVSDLHKVIVGTGELYTIAKQADRPVTGLTPPTVSDQAIIMAWNFIHVLMQWRVIETSRPDVWAQAQAALSALQTAGWLSAASAAAITALRTAMTPAWQPAVTAGDVQTARASP